MCVPFLFNHIITKEFINKLVSLEKNISAEKGDFCLFALFLREAAPDVWDLVVSAPWLEKEKRKDALHYLSEQLQNRFNQHEIINFSRIEIIDLSNPGLDAIHKVIDVEQKLTEVQNRNFFGLEIKQAYIITSKKITGKPQKKKIRSKSKAA